MLPFINIEEGSFYYSLFYRLSFIVAFLLFLYAGYRRNYPVGTLVLISAITFLFVIIGSKLSAYSWGDWQQFFQTGALPPSTAKSSVGALLFGWLGLGLAQRWLKFKGSVLDLFAIALPVALIVQRLGCLMAGCCFGHPTELPWGVRYGAFHEVWSYHFHQDWIPWTSESSLAVHPIPLYLILAFTLVILLVVAFRKRIQAQGNLGLLALGLIFGFRLLIEFFRDPATNHGWGGQFWGLKAIQWILLGLVVLVAAVFVFRALRVQAAPATYDPGRHLIAHLTLFLLLLGAGGLADGWFTFSEQAVIQSLAALTAIALGWTAFRYLTYAPVRPVLAVLLLLSLVWMGQSYQSGAKAEKKDFHALTFGFLGGDLDYDYTYLEDAGCETYSERARVGSPFRSYGMQYEYTNWREKGFMGAGLALNLSTYSLYKNVQKFKGKDSAGSLYGFFGNQDYKLKVGVVWDGYESVAGREGKNKEGTLLLGMRLGEEDKFFLEGGINDDQPYGRMASIYYGGIGVGLRLFHVDNGSNLRFGIGNMADQRAFYLSPEVRFTHFSLLPTARFGEDYNHYGLSLKFRIDAKKD